MAADSPATHSIDLSIEGMTCASCANRIERKLNKMPGVVATVNYATERAHVELPADLTTEAAIAVVEATGYRAYVPQAVAEAPGVDNPELAALRSRLIVCALLTIPVVLMAMVPALQFEYWQWASLALASPVVVWGALPFHRAAWVNARHGAATMDTLISVGVIAAYAWSLYALFLGGAGMPGMTMSFTLTTFAAPPAEDGHGSTDIYLEVAAGVTTLILLGRYLEARAKSRAGEALRALADLGAKDAAVLRSGVEVRVPVAELVVNDEFVVRPGERVATDGVVLTGTSAIDTSLVTGETVPREVGPGDAVIGATINAGGRIVVRATRVGADTHLARITAMVEQAQSGKAEVQRLADRVSAVFVPVVLVIALVTLVAWLAITGEVQAAFTAAVAVLIIACPCALGLATPTALMVGTGRGAQLGILIRGPQVLESTRRVDTIVLDKTGTVTTGQMAVVGVYSGAKHGWDDNALLSFAGAVEAASEHPVAQAIALAAEQRTGELSPVDSFMSHGGRGVQGVVDGHAVLVGRASWLADEWSLPEPAELAAKREQDEQLGRTVVVVAIDGAVAALVSVSDTVKADSAAGIAALRSLGLRPVLLTGDNLRAAKAVAAEVGIDEVRAEVLPEEKLEAVRDLQSGGATVAMAGDGVNDAAALAQSDLGIAMGTGTDVAMEAADITVMRGSLLSVADAVRLSRRTLAIIKGNLFWAFAYNVAMIPLAALGLLNPLFAGAAMALSSLFVVGNSLRLRRFSPISGG